MKPSNEAIKSAGWIAQRGARRQGSQRRSSPRLVTHPHTLAAQSTKKGNYLCIFLAHTKRSENVAGQHTQFLNVLLSRTVDRWNAREKCGYFLYVTDEMNLSDCDQEVSSLRAAHTCAVKETSPCRSNPPGS
jgi:hypothetical protein